jgi:serine/threonine protein kinase
MAQVHRAIEMGTELPRPIALKRMLSHIAGSEEMVKSFVREARLASYLKHQNVAQTYDLGRVGDVYFIVMELITGRNLREVLRHCGTTTGPMPVPVALNILNQICDALDYAHNLRDETGQPLGIIHRDVSPSNIIVSNDGMVKLIDFGIAKASGAGMQTLGGTLKGKFGYMAPEYIAGRIDARADLFAVGVIAHELLTNRPLFAGRDDIDTLTRVRDMHIDPPSKKNPLVPPEIDDVVMTALARDPERRWQHATALRNAMTTLTHRHGLVASNAQAVQWLDWAFTHKPKRRGAEPDTETDGGPLGADGDDLDGGDTSGGDTSGGSEPSISVEPRTVQLVAINQKATLVDTRRPELIHAPSGTPATLPAQRATPRAIADSGSGRATLPGTLRATGNVAVPGTARASAQIPRAASPSAPPIAGASPTGPIPYRASGPYPTSGSPRPGSPSSPPPNAGRPSATILSTSAPAPGYPPGYAIPLPALPPLNAAPFAAPRPARPSSPPPISQGAAAPRIPPPPAAAQPAPAQGSHVSAVVLVVLAAAIAAITVYFVLPLLT